MPNENNKPIGRDADGFEIITDAVKTILNSFPGLSKDEIVRFEELGEGNGIAFINNAGALVYSEKRTIIGTVQQECQYPFLLVYRKNTKSERAKLVSQQFLDLFGRWVCGEPTIYERDSYPVAYPPLRYGRKITKIKRDNLYSQEPQKDGTQDWILPLTVIYTSKFRP